MYECDHDTVNVSLALPRMSFSPPLYDLLSKLLSAELESREDLSNYKRVFCVQEGLISFLDYKKKYFLPAIFYDSVDLS